MCKNLHWFFFRLITINAFDRQTDGRTHRQTDRILIVRPRLHSMQRCKNRPYFLQMSNYTVYFNAKRQFWARALKRSTSRSMSICCTMSRSTLQTTNLRAFANSMGVGTCPSAPCLATPLMTADVRYLYGGWASQCFDLFGSDREWRELISGITLLHLEVIGMKCTMRILSHDPHRLQIL